MQPRYTDVVKYQKQVIGKSALSLEMPNVWIPKPFAMSPLWSRMGTVFTQEQYLYSCPPVDCGVIDVATEDQELRVLRCPIKKPGSRTFILPSELAAFAALVQHIGELDQACNPDFDSSWSHITVERTYVAQGETQRVPGWHVDGFQGVRTARHAIEHSYLWSDNHAFETCIQPFFIEHLDPARHNIFDELTKQANDSNAYAGFSNHVYLIDPYVVHRSPVMKKSGWRTIVRVTLTTTELDDPVNTVNESLDCDQDYPARQDVRNRLFGYEGSVPWEYYAVRKIEKNS